jgi:hypothetical protein
MHRYCVRGQASDGRSKVYTVRTVLVTARTYSQAKWWGIKLLHWYGVPYVRVSLQREPERPNEWQAGK